MNVIDNDRKDFIFKGGPVTIFAPDVRQVEHGKGVPSEPGSVMSVARGVNYEAKCTKCKKVSVAQIGAWEKNKFGSMRTYIQMVRKQTCRHNGCNGFLDYNNITKMFFRNCRYTFQGIRLKNDEDFIITNTHEITTSSDWHIYNGKEFINYVELYAEVTLL